MKTRLLLAALLLALPASAGPGRQPLGAAVTGSMQVGQNPVEQQTPGFYGPCDAPALPGWCQPDQSKWVMNYTGCIWDHDDFARLSTTGDLAKGGSYSLSQCFIADWDQHTDGRGHVTKGGVVGPPGLAVSVCVSPDGCVPVSKVQVDAKTWSYGGCVSVWRSASDPMLQPVEGSNGGVGVRTTFTITVTNTTGRTARDVVVGYSVGDDVTPVRC